MTSGSHFEKLLPKLTEGIFRVPLIFKIVTLPLTITVPNLVLLSKNA